ncbi:MAG: hypothetical protein H7Y00_07355 [Fimbriimonadaceae bacterium]|nr:hypothetical protein [Chitinophagales bacterium]
MEKPGRMTTLLEVLERLRIKNYANEFVMQDGKFTIGNGKFYDPSDLKIIKTYRFEGDSNPSDSCALYLIEASDGLIGYTIDAYGAQSNHEDDGYDEFLTKIPVQDREEQMIFE